MLFLDGSINKNNKEPYSFVIKFVFNSFKDASEARSRIGKYYSCGRITSKQDSSAMRREERLEVIMNTMKSEELYSPGRLYDLVSRHTGRGYKSFQRDISTLIILHKIKRLKNNQLQKEG